MAIRGDIEVPKEVELDHRTYPETEMLKERLEWFQDLKLGVIFHYGLYAQAGIVESGNFLKKTFGQEKGVSFGKILNNCN